MSYEEGHMSYEEGVRISAWGCVLESEPTRFVDGSVVGDKQRELSHTLPGSLA